MRRVNEHKEAWNEYCAETIEFLSNNIPANIVRRVNEHKDAWNEYYATMLRSVVEDKIISLADIVAGDWQLWTMLRRTITISNRPLLSILLRICREKMQKTILLRIT